MRSLPSLLLFAFLFAAAGAAGAQRRVESIVAHLTSDTIGCRSPAVMEDLMALEEVADTPTLTAAAYELVAAGLCRPFSMRGRGSIRVRKGVADAFPDKVHVTDDWAGERLDMTIDPPSSVVFSDPLRPNLWWWIPRSAVAYGP